MKPGYWTLFGLYIIANCVRSAYEWAQTRHIVSTHNRPLFYLMAFVMFVLWTCWFGMCRIDPRSLELPVWLQWTGLGAVILGLILAVGALIQLGGVINIDHLVTSGFFARLRHPMYVGFVLWIVGWALYCEGGVSALAGLFGIGHIMYWRRVEEKFLTETYGDAYLNYREQTWF